MFIWTIVGSSRESVAPVMAPSTMRRLALMAGRESGDLRQEVRAAEVR